MMLRTSKYLFQRAYTQPRPLGMLQPRAMALFSSKEDENVLVEQKEEGVVLITLNRPKALNAALSEADKDPSVKAIVLTGSKKAFAAGADIKEMNSNMWPDTFQKDMLTWWDQVAKLKTPLIGAV